MADFLGLGTVQRENLQLEGWDTHKAQTHRNPKHTHTTRPTPSKLSSSGGEGALWEAFCRKHSVRSVVQGQGLAHSWLLPGLNSRAGEGGARQAWGSRRDKDLLQREWSTLGWNGWERIMGGHLERNGGRVYSPSQAGTCFWGGWKSFPFSAGTANTTNPELVGVEGYKPGEMVSDCMVNCGELRKMSGCLLPGLPPEERGMSLEMRAAVGSTV